MFYLYILYAEKYDRYYVGSTRDVLARLQRHNRKAVPSTKAFTPWVLVHIEEFLTRSEATLRELEIKKMKSRHYIERLINTKGGNQRKV